MYVGQTGAEFSTWFYEHKLAFRSNYHLSKFAQHLVEQRHSFGPIQDTMQVLKFQNKGAHLNTIERFHIYSEYLNDNHLNDEQTIFPKRLFDATLKAHPAIKQ
jgi:hypothetical protein